MEAGDVAQVQTVAGPPAVGRDGELDGAPPEGAAGAAKLAAAGEGVGLEELSDVALVHAKGRDLHRAHVDRFDGDGEPVAPREHDPPCRRSARRASTSTKTTSVSLRSSSRLPPVPRMPASSKTFTGPTMRSAGITRSVLPSISTVKRSSPRRTNPSRFWFGSSGSEKRTSAYWRSSDSARTPVTREEVPPWNRDVRGAP